MDSFYLSYHSVGIFLVFLIAFIQTVFLFIKKDKKPASFWLMGLFAGFSIMLFGYFLAYSFYSPTAAYHRYLTVFVLFANANMSGFAYFFPRDDFSHERHYAVPVAFLVAIIAYLHFIFIRLNLFNFNFNFKYLINYFIFYLYFNNFYSQSVLYYFNYYLNLPFQMYFNFIIFSLIIFIIFIKL